MKQVTAFLLAVIYLAFTTGMVWTLSHSGEYAFERLASNSADAGENSFHKYSKGIQLTNAHKHLAAIGKIKIPRPGFIPVTNAGFTCYRTVARITQKQNLVTQVLPPASLFIQNCVFLI